MTPTVYNLGSLNIDRVLRVPRIVRPGETLAATALTEFAGGKGANQSVALARAGGRAVHIGRVGADGPWLIDKLSAAGVDTRGISTSPSPTGQAIIQVDPAGQNSIVVLAGANAEITAADVERALDSAVPGDWLLTQNETSAVAAAIELAKARGLRVAFNPAPFDDRVRSYPLHLVDLLCVNQTELAALGDPPPKCNLLHTLGPAGARLQTATGSFSVAGLAVTAVDTTAADHRRRRYLPRVLFGRHPARTRSARLPRRGQSRRRPLRHPPGRHGFDSRVARAAHNEVGTRRVPLPQERVAPLSAAGLHHESLRPAILPAD